MTEITEREQKLVDELLRTRYLLDGFMDPICFNLYPQKVNVHGVSFRGTPSDKVFQIHKLVDHGVRHIQKTLAELGFKVPQMPSNYGEVYDEISTETGITGNGHTD